MEVSRPEVLKQDYMGSENDGASGHVEEFCTKAVSTGGMSSTVSAQIHTSFEVRDIEYIFLEARARTGE